MDQVLRAGKGGGSGSVYAVGTRTRIPIPWLLRQYWAETFQLLSLETFIEAEFGV